MPCLNWRGAGLKHLTVYDLVNRPLFLLLLLLILFVLLLLLLFLLLLLLFFLLLLLPLVVVLLLLLLLLPLLLLLIFLLPPSSFLLPVRGRRAAEQGGAEGQGWRTEGRGFRMSELGKEVRSFALPDNGRPSVVNTR